MTSGAVDGEREERRKELQIFLRAIAIAAVVVSLIVVRVLLLG